MYVKTIQLEKPNAGDYAKYLRLKNIKFTEVDQHYYQIGNIKGEQGWIVHLSVIREQIQELLAAILPELLKHKISFKIIKDSQTADKALSGALGYARVGKIVRIYPDSLDKTLQLVDKLITLTKPFKGPVVLTDSHLAGIVYTRYGSFNPVLGPNANGQTERYIHDIKGNLVVDANEIPFHLPSGITWPFLSFNPKPVENPKTLHNRYMIRTEIRVKAKGRVLKAYSVRGLAIKSCIIKESKYAMCDEIGRDLSERLHWQKKLHNDLCASIRLPKIFDFFQERGNTYLVMEYIKGRSLQEGINLFYLDSYWPALGKSKKLQLLDLFLEVLRFVKELHRRGFVHRDLTVENFILDRDNKLVMIDLELSYDLNVHSPTPPYRLGTLGYMSPEQLNTETPTPMEDIFALGALMIVFFGNSSPSKFNTADIDDLRSKLDFYIGEKILIDTIVQCLRRDPGMRPSLEAISDAVKSCKEELLTSREQRKATQLYVRKEQVQEAIDQALMSLTSASMTLPNKPWHSNAVAVGDAPGNRQSDHQYYPGFHTGISGILHTVSTAHLSGIKIPNQLTGVYARNYKYLQRTFLSLLPNVPPGLYYGASGVAVALASGMESRLIAPTLDTKAMLKQCLQMSSIGLDVAHGSAGQGLAVLRAKEILGDDLTDTLIKPHLSLILKAQANDGSWVLNGEKKVSLSSGIAGIVVFLLKCATTFQNRQALAAAVKGLQYLTANARRANNKIYWRASNKNATAEIGVAEGFTGIALSFLRGYALTQDPTYKKIAEDALNNYGQYPMTADLSMATGLSGVGEVYFEAHRILQDQRWQAQAEWIVNQLIRTLAQQPDGNCYWTMSTNQFASADLATGIAGPLRLLIEYQTEYQHPFLDL